MLTKACCEFGPFGTAFALLGMFFAFGGAAIRNTGSGAKVERSPNSCTVQEVFCRSWSQTDRDKSHSLESGEEVKPWPSRGGGLCSEMKLISLAAILLGFMLSTSGQSPTRLSGLVVDQNGAAIPNASVTWSELEDGRSESKTSTDSNGRFTFDAGNAKRGTLTVDAAGFEPSRTEIVVVSDGELRIVLSPAPVGETVTITGSETKLNDTPASVVVVDRQKLDLSGASTLDDRLRQVPGFSLFRRAGSRTANPTTQGVSLRGVGASGASRALVLADGVPLNDPFGGWVYWGRVPLESISQVEILRGSSGDLYGSSAIGGVISVITRRPGPNPFTTVETSYGTERTTFASAYSSIASASWSASVAGEFFKTDGFIPVAKEVRGISDTKANVERWDIVPFVQRSFGDRDRIFGSVEFFHEERQNGTRLQENETDLRVFSAGLDWDIAKRNLFSLRASGGIQRYDQTFSAVAPDRNSESLNRLQRVPTNFLGIFGQWTITLRRNVLFAGAELRNVDGHSDETGMAAGSPTSRLDAGGREFTGAAFAGLIVPFTARVTVNGGFRIDWWLNVNGFSRTTLLSSGAVTATTFPDREESAFSPRLSVLYRATGSVSVAANFSEGFRRPTLNELYRNFRVGEVVTLANADLRAERARSLDAAVIVNAFERRLYFRAGPYCTAISGNVSNVTLSATPFLITRQRQNVGRTRSCGIEVDGEFRVSDELTVSGGYLFVDSRVTRFPANAALEGLRIPQIPRHQFTSQLTYSSPKYLTASIQLRAVARQFDDDQNQFQLAGFSTIDVFGSRQLSPKVEIFAAAENLFDSKIESGRTPLLTFASPRTFRVGLRIRLGRK